MNNSPAPRRRRKLAASTACPENVFTAYLRVSTREQAESHAGLDAQKAHIELYATVHGLEIREWRIDAGESGKNMDRPNLKLALDDVRTGHTRGIITAKLDRLSRSVIDFHHLMTEAQRDDWNIVLVDLGVDLRTPNGQLIAGIIAQIAQWERLTIGVRTKEGLAAKREQGVRLGRPRQANDDLLELVVDTYLRLTSWSEAARELTDDGILTARGAQLWYPATVRNMVMSQDGKALLAAYSEAV